MPVRFGHGALGWSDNSKTKRRRFLIASYHPSQQNTFTGKLTPTMLRNVFEKARELIQAATPIAHCHRPMHDR